MKFTSWYEISIHVITICQSYIKMLGIFAGDLTPAILEIYSVNSKRMRSKVKTKEDLSPEKANYPNTNTARHLNYRME